MAETIDKKQYDRHLIDSFLRVIYEFGIQSYIETGFRDAHNLKLITENYPSLYAGGCEIDNDKYVEAIKYLNTENSECVEISADDSITFLKSCEEFFPDPVLFFLDSNVDHRPDLLPLRDEISIIGEHWDKYILCIHDFGNPNQPGFKWNSISNIEYIKDLLPAGCQIQYNRLSAYGWANIPVGAVFIWVGFDDIGNFIL